LTALDGQGAELIQVHVAGLRQLFNSIDPSPFHEKDLDGAADQFIVGWARGVPRDRPLALAVHVDEPVRDSEADDLRNAIHAFCRQRAATHRQHLHQLFRRGRISLLIALCFLAFSIVASNLVEQWSRGRGVGEVIREGLIIGGWVAMWRPLEIFLYDWWPIRAEAVLADRLAAMPVRLIQPSA